MNENSKIEMSFALVIALSLGVSGCGSSGSDSDNITSSATDIIVERGKVYDANVTDSSTPHQVAKQKEGKNIYTFAKTPKYPVVVNGGWIDVNDNGKMDTNDTKLDIEMKSYSNVVTPITTYIADDNKTYREQKLEELVTKLNSSGVGSDTNITVEDLQKVPSKAPKEVMVLSNATFKDMKEKNSSKVDVSSIMSQFETIYSALPSNANATSVEEQVMNTLKSESLVHKLTEQDISDHVSVDGNKSTADLSNVNVIHIYKNMDAKQASVTIAMYKDYPDFTSSSVSASASCKDYGFTQLISEKNLQGLNTKLYRITKDVVGSNNMVEFRNCYEYDYSKVEVYNGSTNMIMGYNLNNMTY